MRVEVEIAVVEGARREEILETAATMLASSGLRTSLHDIADACGILPGSLYHHFTSKEAIIVELVQRYLDELDCIAAHARAALRDGEPQTFERRIIDFGEAIAQCAARHRAALILTLYEPPSGSGEELTKLARRTPEAIDAAMREVLEAGVSTREIRPDIDLSLLSQRLCQSMLHVGVGVYHQSSGAETIPAMKCGIVLHGLATRRPAKRTLDGSPALRAARARSDVGRRQRRRNRRRGPPSRGRKERVRATRIRDDDRTRHLIRGRAQHQHRLPALRFEG